MDATLTTALWVITAWGLMGLIAVTGLWLAGFFDDPFDVSPPL